MVVNEESPGPVLTRADDPRVTWIGRRLRKWKLDELPQLLNVFHGDMSFVGPRPQPTKLWKDASIQEQASYVLSVRPGITSQATLNFRNEEELLAPLTSEEVEEQIGGGRFGMADFEGRHFQGHRTVERHQTRWHHVRVEVDRW